MLLVKGRAVSFDLTDGAEIDAPTDSSLLHDPTGRYWKKTSCLVMPIRKDGDEDDGDDFTRDYYGKNYQTRVGDVTLPPKRLDAWRYEGDVEEIWYTRPGKKYPGRYRHQFNGRNLRTLVKGTGRVRLYSRGSIFRLDMPRGAVADGRGFFWP